MLCIITLFTNMRVDIPMKLQSFAAVNFSSATGIGTLNVETELFSEILVYSEHLTFLLAQDFIEFVYHTGFKKSLLVLRHNLTLL